MYDYFYFELCYIKRLKRRNLIFMNSCIFIYVVLWLYLCNNDFDFFWFIVVNVFVLRLYGFNIKLFYKIKIIETNIIWGKFGVRFCC